MATLLDVASPAGVSSSTVSRVINRSAPVDAVTGLAARAVPTARERM